MEWMARFREGVTESLLTVYRLETSIYGFLRGNSTGGRGIYRRIAINFYL